MQTNFFTALSITTCGMILYDNGLYFMLRDFLGSEALDIYTATAFAGSLIAEVLLVRFPSTIIAVCIKYHYYIAYNRIPNVILDTNVILGNSVTALYLQDVLHIIT